MTPGLTASFTRRFTSGPEISVNTLHLPPDSGVTVVFGASGSGKTTILRCLAGLDSPDEGRIELGGEVWFDSRKGRCVPPQQRRIGFVPQDYLLFPHLTVAANIAYGLPRASPTERRAAVDKSLRWLHLEGLGARMPHELSGGQQQRVALARAVARQPQLLLLDEPLSALDAPSRQRLRGELRHWLDELRLPTLLVTHDRTEALTLGSRIIVLDQGRVVQAGPVGEVFNHPANLASAKILGMETVLMGHVVERAEGMVAVRIGNHKLLALADELPPDASLAHVCIRAEDVVLMRATEVVSSARNRLPATVASVQHEAPLARVELDCGFSLKALITRQALEELHLQVGNQVIALIKAPHVHLIAAQHD